MKLILKSENEKKTSSELGLIKIENNTEIINISDTKDTILPTKKILLGIGSNKRKSDQNVNEYKFIYKFNEGVTNKVTRTLPIDYFYS